jgi:hypothetical protein
MSEGIQAGHPRHLDLVRIAPGCDLPCALVTDAGNLVRQDGLVLRRPAPSPEPGVFELASPFEDPVLQHEGWHPSTPGSIETPHHLVVNVIDAQDNIGPVGHEPLGTPFRVVDEYGLASHSFLDRLDMTALVAQQAPNPEGSRQLSFDGF